MLSFSKRLSCFALALGASVALAASASALSLVVTGPSDGPQAPGASVTFTIGFDQATSLNGYELFFTWDQDELAFDSASQLFPDFLAPNTFPFTVLNTGLGSGSVGIGRASVLQLSPFTTTDLLSLTFLATGAGDTPGSAIPGASLILGLSAAGLTGGFSPGSITVTNPDPFFTFTVLSVPEPGLVLLLGSGLLLAGFARRRS